MFAADASAQRALERAVRLESRPHCERARELAHRRFREQLVSSGVPFSPTAGTFPSVIFAHRPSVRASRLPRFFPRSALYRSIIAARSKSPSCPNAIAAQELVAEHVGSAASPPRVASPNARAIPSGSTALRSDLLIFCPLNVRNPCAKTVVGSGRPGAHQERRPVHRVEAQDVLADEMHDPALGAPERLGASGCPGARSSSSRARRTTRT